MPSYMLRAAERESQPVRHMMMTTAIMSGLGRRSFFDLSFSPSDGTPPPPPPPHRYALYEITTVQVDYISASGPFKLCSLPSDPHIKTDTPFVASALQKSFSAAHQHIRLYTHFVVQTKKLLRLLLIKGDSLSF
jgi:hypothetical protein